MCDVDKNHLSQAASMVKDKISLYHDFRDLILDKNVDIVHIATLPHWHGIMSVEAAKAGKDIFCEKPMTRTIGEGKGYGKLLRNMATSSVSTPGSVSRILYGLGTPVKPLKN